VAYHARCSKKSYSENRGGNGILGCRNGGMAVAMKQNQLSASHPQSAPGSGVALTRVLVLLLLLAVPVLSTLAKDSAYLPQSNTAHFINIAAKMKVADAPLVVIKPQVVEPLVALVLPEPEIATTRQDELEVPPVPKVSLKVCLQHRSPPIVTA
jgi:hypothetical protein